MTYQGEWVTEESETRISEPDPSFFRVLSEEAWLSLAPAVPAHVFRLAGIYGPGRSALDTVRKDALLSRVAAPRSESGRGVRRDEGGDGMGAGTRKFVSRVHVSDIAQVVLRSMENPVTAGRIYNVADSMPCPRAQVHQYARELLGMVKNTSEDEAGVLGAESGGRKGGGGRGGSVRTRRTDNKRVSNRRILEELGVEV